MNDRLKIIDRATMTLRQIEEHFFKVGYEYALLHFGIAVTKIPIESGLEKRIRGFMDFLDDKRG